MIELNFEPLAPDATKHLLDDVRSQLPRIKLHPEKIAVQVASLPFYTEFKLYAFSEALRAHAITHHILYKFGDANLLDGTNEPIYSVNERSPIKLDGTTCVSYAKFFLHFVHGQFGRFIIAEKPDDISWFADADDKQKLEVDSYLMPVTYKGIDADDFHTLAASVIFKNTLLRVDIKIAYYERDLFNPELAQLDHFNIGQIKFSSQEFLLNDLNVLIDAPPVSVGLTGRESLVAEQNSRPEASDIPGERAQYLRSAALAPSRNIAAEGGSLSKESKMIFYKEERTALFIDGVSLYISSKALGFDVDFKRLLEVFAARGRLIRAFYYALLIDSNDVVSGPLLDWLRGAGYCVSTRKAESIADSQGRIYIRENLDMELALDVMQMSDHLEHVIIFSGDKAFRRLVELVQLKGIRVSVVSTSRSDSPIVSNELRYQADNYIDLYDLKAHIAISNATKNDQPSAKSPSDEAPEPNDSIVDVA